MKKERKSSIFLLAVLAAIVFMTGGCLVPNNGYLMELNRNGKWREAERVGQEMLSHRRTFTHSQLCETYFHVIYAQTRMGKKSEAVRLMNEYDTFSTREKIDPELLWLDREMAELKDELGLLDVVQHTLVAAMEENGKGNYPRARELCDTVLAMEGADAVQKATAHFVAAVCSIRLKEAGEAESHFAAFTALKPALPPGHQTLAEEAHVREELKKLK